MIRRSLACLLLLGILLPSPAPARTPVTEAEVLAVLDEDHAAVIALDAGVAEATAAARASYLDNPGLDFFHEAPGDLPSQSTLALAWRPPLDGRRGLRRDVGTEGLAAASRDRDWNRLALRDSLRSLYADWWRLTELETLLADQETRIRDLADRSLRRRERGEESGLDAGRLRFAAVEIAAGRATLGAALARVRGDLSVFVPDLPVDARPQRPSLPPPPTTTASAEHPALAAERHRLSSAESARRLAGRVLDFPELLVGWTRIDEDLAEGAGPVFGVRWDLPLFDRNQGEKARAERALGVAEARLRLVEAEVATRAAVAHDAYVALRDAAVAGNEATADAAALLAAASAAFANGESTVTDLIETLRSVLSGRTAAIDLYHEALAAHRGLELGLGRPLTDGGRP